MFEGIKITDSATKTVKILASSVNDSVDTYMTTTKGFTKSSTNETIDGKEYCVYTKA
jgi:hypothetical protein